MFLAEATKCPRTAGKCAPGPCIETTCRRRIGQYRRLGPTTTIESCSECGKCCATSAGAQTPKTFCKCGQSNCSVRIIGFFTIKNLELT